MTPVDVGVREPFDPRAGFSFERAVFENRLIVVCLCALITLLLGWQATKLHLQASFEKTIPVSHPFVVNFIRHQNDLNGLGNVVRIAVAPRVESPQTIYDSVYLEALRRLNDEVFLLPGVDRIQMKSLWTPNTRWLGVTEEGLEGGPVIPDGYDGSVESLRELAANVARSGEVGTLVAANGASTVMYLPLLATDDTGQALNYAALSRSLEALREKYRDQGLDLHITGFAKIVGDLIEGVRSMLVFFAVAVLFSTLMVYAYTRCVRSTVLVVMASIIAVLWQLGLLPLLGFSIDPYSILVPFLVFAIGMSHGAQKMNGIMQDIGRGADKLVAARLTFRRLFLAGLTALVADAVGFAVLLVIDIQVIRELAISASIGVAALIVTNLILLPVLLSYVGVSPRAAVRSAPSRVAATVPQGVWRWLNRFTQPRVALVTIGAATLLGAAGFAVSTQLKIGDLDPGAPELRADSRYNRDVAFLNKAYGANSDVLAVMVSTPEGQCASYDTINKVDELEWSLAQIEGVESTRSLARLNRQMLMGMNEGHPKWYALIKNQSMLNTVTAGAPRGLYNDSCSLLTVYVNLQDHKADTLARVVQAVEAFGRQNDTDEVKFMLAAGSAGIEAATNIVVRHAWRQMLFLVYAAVAVLCFTTFRSWRAVLVAMLPLLLTSFLAEALMVALGIGVKVATLPVIALGVGIGVDYSLYILSVTLTGLRQGKSLAEAYGQALAFTGRVVMLTGLTLAVGVITWVASPIKFQADMGLLLAFMFLLNMLGALVLLPALARWLLVPCASGPRSMLQPAVDA